MPNEHLAELRILITQVEQTEDETQRAAALAELQRVGATALREAVSRARDRGVPWRTLAGELQVAVTTLHHQFTASRVTPPRDDQPRRVLPTPSMDQFVGRQQELAELGGLLSSSRLVTLSGTGGIGKTRLAGEFVRRSSTEDPRRRVGHPFAHRVAIGVTRHKPLRSSDRRAPRPHLGRRRSTSPRRTPANAACTR
jgi:hypothetical protein